MQMDINGGGDHSPELQLALKKFEDACNSLQTEQTKLINLEKRRKQLQEDLESLRNELLIEKAHVQAVMEEHTSNDNETMALTERTSLDDQSEEDSKIVENIKDSEAGK